MIWKDITPQLLGTLPSSFSFLILPYTKDWDNYLEKVLILDVEDLPQDWQFLKSILEGNFEKTLSHINSIKEEDVKNYNKSIITGEIYEVEDEDLKALQSIFFNEDYLNNINISDIQRNDIKAFLYFLKGEKVLSTNRQEAIKYFDEALKLVKGKSPVFETQILLKKVKVLIDEKGVNFPIIALLENLYNIVKTTKADVLKAEVEFNLGNAYSSLGNIKEAIDFYMKALQTYKIDKYPYMYALVNNNMGLAYLSIPAQDIEDQMRLAYGVQCLKNALKVFTKDKYPDEWASSLLNYANALQYLPTANPIKNLLEAVDLYKEIAEYRKEKNDEIGYARTIANMGNALAHLGKLEEAKVYLREALILFTKFGMKEEIEAIKEILNEIQLIEVGNNGK